MNKTMKLSDMHAKEKAKVVQLTGSSLLKKKLLDMGILPGVAIEVSRVAPLGDPVEIKLRGYFLSLRKDEASTVTVER